MKRISLEFLLIFPSAFSKRKKNHPLLLAVFLLSHTLTNSRFQFRPTHIYSLFFWHNTTDLDWLNLQHQLKYFFFHLAAAVGLLLLIHPHPALRPPPSRLPGILCFHQTGDGVELAGLRRWMPSTS